MSLQFAHGTKRCAAIAQVLKAPQLQAFANDNIKASEGQDFQRTTLLREALRFFAQHGAGAAERAWINAEQAFFADRRSDYLNWMAICRTLDQRLATSSHHAV